MQLLKLSAFDQEDLEILSAHLQDALLNVGDMIFLSKQRRFALTASRIVENDTGKEGERRLCGVQFLDVESVRSRRIRLDARSAVLSLLTIKFTAADLPPSGRIELIFSGGGEIILNVGCIEAVLEDLGPSRKTRHLPRHDLDNLPANELGKD